MNNNCMKVTRMCDVWVSGAVSFTVVPRWSVGLFGCL